MTVTLTPLSLTVCSGTTLNATIDIDVSATAGDMLPMSFTSELTVIGQTGMLKLFWFVSYIICMTSCIYYTLYNRT